MFTKISLHGSSGSFFVNYCMFMLGQERDATRDMIARIRIAGTCISLSEQFAYDNATSPGTLHVSTRGHLT